MYTRSRNQHTDLGLYTTKQHHLRFSLGCSVPLSTILEPVADLRSGQARLLGQLSLLARGRVGIFRVPLPQNDARLLLEAITRLLAVPDRARQGELASNAVLPDGSERLTAQTFGLDVVRLQPQLLHLRMRLQREIVALEHAVEIGKVTLVKRDECARLHDTLVLLDLITGRQAPQKACQPLDVTALLQHVADARNLLRRESVSAVGNHSGRELVTVHDGSSKRERLHCKTETAPETKFRALYKLARAFPPSRVLYATRALHPAT